MATKKLVRNKQRSIVSGVCSGLGEYFNLSPWIFRVIFILPFFWAFWPGVISTALYFVLSKVLPGSDDKDELDVEYEVLDDNASWDSEVSWDEEEKDINEDDSGQ